MKFGLWAYFSILLGVLLHNKSRSRLRFKVIFPETLKWARWRYTKARKMKFGVWAYFSILFRVLLRSKSFRRLGLEFIMLINADPVKQANQMPPWLINAYPIKKANQTLHPG